MGFAVAVPIVTAVIGAAVTAYGAVQAGNAQRDAANYQAQVARNNATIAQQNAQAASQAGQAAATTQSLKSRAIAGAVLAGEAASGVDVNTGSSEEVRRTQREIGTLDTQTAASNAALRVYGYRTQETSFESDAILKAAGAKNAEAAGQIGAVGSLLSGASSVGEKWAKLQDAGAV